MYKGRLVFEIEDRHKVKDPAPVEPFKVQIAGVDFCLSELRAGTNEIRQQLVLISPPCESEAEAERLTRVAEASLITLALERRFGIVLAPLTPPPKFTSQWLEERSDATGISHRTEILGRTTHPSPTAFVSIGGFDLDTGTTTLQFARHVGYAASRCPVLNERLRTAYDLWVASRLPQPSKARLLLLIASAEASIGDAQRTAAEIKFLKDVGSLLSESSLDDNQKRGLSGGLSALRKKSKKAICAEAFHNLGGEDAKKAFARAYGYRSATTHGIDAAPLEDIVGACNNFETYLVQLLPMGLELSSLWDREAFT